MRINVIVSKELLQDSRRPMGYVLRIGLPALAIVILAPRLVAIVRVAGQDWRAIANATRPFFMTVAWLGMIALSGFAVLFVAASFRREHERRTIDVLRTTPLRAGHIVLGKFVSSVARLMMIALAVAPVMALWLSIGRFPRELAAAAIGVIGASVFYFGALAALTASAFPPGGLREALGGTLLVGVLGGLVLLGVTVLEGNPFLIAALPPWALGHILSGNSPSTMPITAFIAVAIVEPVALGAIALTLAPAVFRRSITRASERRTHRPSKSLAGLLSGRLPRMREGEHPFTWIDKGKRSWRMRRGFVLSFAALVCATLIVIRATWPGGLFHPVVYRALALAGIGLYTISAAIYATGVFAREKVSRTAEQLVLTGKDASVVFFAKADLIKWCSLRHLAGIPIILLAYIVSPRDVLLAAIEIPALLLVAWSLPQSVGMVGMVFSIVAKSPARALTAMMVAPVLLVLLSMLTVSGMMIAGPWGIMLGVAGILLALFLTRRSGKWSVHRLSAALASHLLFALLIASCFSGFLLAVFAGLVLGIRSLIPQAFQSVTIEYASIVLVACVTMAVAGIILRYRWFALGVDLFNTYMLDARAGRHVRTGYW